MSHAAVLVAVDGVDPKDPEAVERAVAEQMAPFDENGEWFRDGSRWDWWVIGGRWSGYLGGADVVRRGDVDLEAMGVKREADLRRCHQRAMADERVKKNPSLGLLLYGVQEGEDEDAFVRRKTGGHPFPVTFAFLRNRVWSEGERMGFWGLPAATECELRTDEKPNICLFEQDGAKVVSWQGAEDWAEKFWERFVERLPEDAVLVVVDYHV